VSEPTVKTLLVTVSGEDRPGVTSAFFDAIADVGAEVLDLEQVVVRGHLTLAMLLSTGDAQDRLREVVTRERDGKRAGRGHTTRESHGPHHSRLRHGGDTPVRTVRECRGGDVVLPFSPRSPLGRGLTSQARRPMRVAPRTR
jgi:predicted amino acid-binding ACT domain protein